MDIKAWPLEAVLRDTADAESRWRAEVVTLRSQVAKLKRQLRDSDRRINRQRRQITKLLAVR